MEAERETGWQAGLSYKLINGSLKEQLNLRKWSHTDLAKKLNVTPSAVGSWVNLRSIPTDPVIISGLELLFNLPMEMLFPNRELLSIIKGKGMNKRQVATSKNLTRMIGNYEVREQLRLEATTDPEKATTRKMVIEQLNECLDSLTYREQKIIKMRFGIGCRPHTLEEVGAEFDVTRERIRHIEAKALSKLRKNPKTKLLHQFFDVV